MPSLHARFRRYQAILRGRTVGLLPVEWNISERVRATFTVVSIVVPPFHPGFCEQLTSLVHRVFTQTNSLHIHWMIGLTSAQALEPFRREQC
jgi:hypothetical protein